MEQVQQCARVRWVPRVLLNGTTSSARSSHAQHKTLLFNTTAYKTKGEWAEQKNAASKQKEQAEYQTAAAGECLR